MPSQPSPRVRLTVSRVVLLFLPPLLAFGLAACGKRPPALQTPQAQQVNAQPLTGEVNEAMTAQLRAFIQMAGRAPTNFTELARARLDMVPRAKPGMMWAIDYATKEVKLVPH